MYKKKILIIQETISHYNVPLFELLNSYYDVTVLHSDINCSDKEYSFNVIYAPVLKMHYKIHKQNLFSIANKFDVVICMFNFSFISFRLLGILPRKYKLIYWGIGVCASSSERYDSSDKYTKSFINGINKSDAIIFYCEYPKQKYIKMGLPSTKMFVANNTVKVNKINLNRTRNTILFVGSLNRNKKIDVLVEQYLSAYRSDESIPDLYIIGDGSEYNRIHDFIFENHIQQKIHMCGEIIDDNILEKYYSDAYICISPDQAGLSVLKSMGYGVAFVTHKNAITGGEIFNIHDKVDGLLIDDFNQIKDIILDVKNNPQFYVELSENAYRYYWEKCKISDMCTAFDQAIKFVLN